MGTRLLRLGFCWWFYFCPGKPWRCDANEPRFDWHVAFCSLLSESRCDRRSQTSSSSSPSSTCPRLGRGGQIQEPQTDRRHLGLGIALFTYVAGFVTAAPFCSSVKTCKTWFQAYLWPNERAARQHELQYVMEPHVHTVPDAVGVNPLCNNDETLALHISYVYL